jgi:hypothetical protein
LAFGVYQAGKPDGGFLLADKATTTDWGGKRFLVPIAAASSSYPVKQSAQK